jgi:mRNA interferase MazF
MTKYKQGDVVIVGFIFTEGQGSKKRPALILSSDEYHRSRQEVILAAITSNIKRVLVGDTKISQWREAGLRFPSLVTGIIQTIKANMIVYALGSLSKKDFQTVRKNLQKAFGF